MAGLLGRLESFLLGPPRKVKAAGRDMVVAANLETEGPRYPDDNYLTHARLGYRGNEIAYAAIRRISKAVAEYPLRVYRREDGTVDNAHPLRALLERPNPLMSESYFWTTISLYTYVAGNAFALKVRAAAGNVVELWPLRPDRIVIVADRKKIVAGYEVADLGTGRTFVPADDVLHWKFPNPEDDLWGMSPLRVALRAYSLDNAATDYAKTILDNHAIPRVIIRVPFEVDEEKSDRIKAKWRAKFGKRHAADPAVLQTGMEIERVAMNFEELAFSDLRSTEEARILAALEVPPILVGAKVGLEHATFSNYEEARRSFHEDTIGPLLNYFDDVVNAGLATDAEFGDDVRVRFDPSSVAAFAETRRKGLETANLVVGGSWVTVNEARTMAGLPPRDGGDVYLRPLSTLTIPAGEAPASSGEKGVEVRVEDHRVVVTPRRIVSATGKSLRKPGRSKARDDLALLSHILDRIRRAETYYGKLRGMAVGEFEAEGKDTLRAFDRSVKGLTPDDFRKIDQALSRLALEWRDRLGEASRPIFSAIIADAAESAALEIGATFDLSSAAQQEFVRRYSYRFASEVGATSASHVRDVMLRSLQEGLTIAETRDALLGKFSEWTASRADAVAQTETIRAANQGAQDAYRQMGVTAKEWVAAGDACPYCAALDGKIVGIDETFIKDGETFHPEGADAPLDTSYEGSVGTPPAHVNCRCAISAIILEPGETP